MSQASGNDPGAPIRVLIADGSEADREALSASVRLAEPAAHVVAAGDAVGAFSTLLDEAFDLVFLDRFLPGVDPLTLYKWTQSLSKTSFVLVSSKLMAGWPDLARMVRAYEVLLKPFQDDQIAKVVEASRRMQEVTNVLVVDANPESRGSLEKLLNQSRFRVRVTSADSGRLAPIMALRQSCGLALVDNALPDIDGLEASVQIMTRSPATRTVLIRSDAALTTGLQRLGIAAVLPKPFDNLDLDDALHRVFNLWRPYLLNALRPAPKRARLIAS